MRLLRVFIGLFLSMLAITASAQEAVITLQSTVTGNQEQPRVLYIIPWQSPESPVLPYNGIASQLDDVFGHLEREELRRILETLGELDVD